MIHVTRICPLATRRRRTQRVCVRSGNRGAAARVAATGVAILGPNRQQASRLLVDRDITIMNRITVWAAAIAGPLHQLVYPCAFARLPAPTGVLRTATAQTHPMRRKSALIALSRRPRTIVIQPGQQAAANVPTDPDQGQFDPIGHGSGMPRTLRQRRLRAQQ